MTTSTQNAAPMTRAQVIEYVLLQNLNQKLTTALAFGVAKELDELITKFATGSDRTPAALASDVAAAKG